MPLPVALAAVLALFPPPALAAAPCLLVAPDTAAVEAPEPLVLERPYLATQDVRFSDSSDESSTDALIHAQTLRVTNYIHELRRAKTTSRVKTY